MHATAQLAARPGAASPSEVPFELLDITAVLDAVATAPVSSSPPSMPASVVISAVAASAPPLASPPVCVLKLPCGRLPPLTLPQPLREAGLHDGMPPVQFLDALLHATGHPVARWRGARVPTCSPGPNTMGECSNYGKLVTALRQGRRAEFYALLAAPGSSCTAANSCGHTLLHCAARMGDVEVARFLVEGGADPALTDESGKTALHDACWSVELNPAMLILLADGDPRLFCATDRFNATPLEYCHPGMHKEMCHFVTSMQPHWWAPGVGPPAQ